MNIFQNNFFGKKYKFFANFEKNGQRSHKNEINFALIFRETFVAKFRKNF